MSPRGQEKRRHGRVPGRLTLQTISSDLGTIEMETDNLSLGGATCLSDHPIPPMTQLRLNIFLPSSDGRPAHMHFPMEVDAVVVRSERLNGVTPVPGYRLALFFAGMQEGDRQALARYLDTQPA